MNCWSKSTVLNKCPCPAYIHTYVVVAPYMLFCMLFCLLGLSPILGWNLKKISIHTGLHMWLVWNPVIAKLRYLNPHYSSTWCIFQFTDHCVGMESVLYLLLYIHMKQSDLSNTKLKPSTPCQIYGPCWLDDISKSKTISLFNRCFSPLKFLRILHTSLEVSFA